MTAATTEEVLVVGAGPTGLTTACTLFSMGVPCRVVDRREGPGELPKALILWSGALECLRRLGVTDELASQALPLRGASYWSRKKRIGKMDFDIPNTAFPQPLCVPQPVTEAALRNRLTELGGKVEWGVEAIGVSPHADGVTVALRSGQSGARRTDFSWVVAADGTHSRLRSDIGISMEGHTYDRVFLIGDGPLEGPAPEAEAQYHITTDGVLVMVPLPGGEHRVFFDVPSDAQTEAPTDERLQQLLDARGPGNLRITGSRWTSLFTVHAKVSPSFRVGRVFLAGDSAHAHSPAGGQGLNTGVQDGYDLGWKLASVLRGLPPDLLDSYEPERKPPSARAVKNADQQTRMWLLRNPMARAMRDATMQSMSRRGLLEKQMLPQLAQLDLDLSDSPALRDLAGSSAVPKAVRLGRRVPDIPLTPTPEHSTDASSLLDYLGSGGHVLLAFGGEAAGEVAIRAAQWLGGRGTSGLTRVLWVCPTADSPSPAIRSEAAGAGCDTARTTDTALGSERTSPWLAYIRPDGIVGARAGVSSVLDLLSLLPRVSA
ncbi:FAD-dependent monooxygenase [Streptomyces triticirhizae]|uniref:Oxygenase n=1 Tax=Streptomyces triticirhizae TaxID=2483353 RepID=A0A3M2LUG0_9ACTN|nr:FAD-dependent monooxygenase [Streptomyces triticirhizae]RMI41131.1 oxygenase [Streptomyces triticirhizae]